MTTLLLTQQPDGCCVISRQITTRERVAVRLRAWQLDVAIASGADPDSSAALSLRANTLIGSQARRRVSRSVRRLLQQSRRPPHSIHESVPVCWRQVIRARPLFEELVDRLEEPGPVDARGIAQLQLLLTDGTSPLFTRHGVNSLQAALEAALDALDPLP